MNNPAAPLETVFDSVIQQLHTTLTHLSVSSADRYEAEAPIIMDVVKYLLRQKQQLAINKAKSGSAPEKKNSTTAPTATINNNNNIEAPKIPWEAAKNITADTNGKSLSKPVEPVFRTESSLAADDFLNKFEMPGKFAVPDKTSPKKTTANGTNTTATVPVKTENTVAEVRPAVPDSDATIMYDSPELAAAAANGAAATAALSKKRKLDDSDEGGSRKKARLEGTPQDLFDFLRKSGMKEVISLQIRRSKHEASAEWGEFNSTVQFKLANKFAATPVALLDLFFQEKTLESTTKINAWTHLYLDEDLVLTAPQIFEKTPYAHVKKFKFARGTKIDTIRGMLFFAKEIEKKAALGPVDDSTQLIFKNVSYPAFCSLYGMS